MSLIYDQLISILNCTVCSIAKMIFDPSDTGHNFQSLSTGVQYRFKLWTVGMYDKAGNSNKTEVNVSTCKCIKSLKSHVFVSLSFPQNRDILTHSLSVSVARRYPPQCVWFLI